MFPITDAYELPSLPLGDYYLLENEAPSANRKEPVKYLILNSDKIPILAADCTVQAGVLHSIVLTAVDVSRPVAEIARLNNDTYAVHVGDYIGTIEKTDGWHFRDNTGYVSLGMTRKNQKPPHPLLNFFSMAISLEPIDDGQATLYRFWQRGTDESFATFYADLNNLEIKAIESIFSPYICIFLVLTNQLSK